uniref:Complement C5a receptor 1 n=1 Tax=Callorhinchus milii TaxID=7868 RepID=A0A4W3H2G3_CALMI|eukprot:gi/632990244/ref/XP_007884079.1/ PREDICTED: C3a anaphylatoxin chemotactic receptor-like [Callorhinchus milii]
MDYTDPDNWTLYYGNYSEYNYTNGTENPTTLSGADNLSLVLFFLTFLAGVPGNLMVIWVMGFKMPRTVNVVWFLNLAVADLVYCLLLPFQIANILLKYHWPYGVLLCKLLPSSIILNLFASVFLLSAISVDRCVTVMLPVWSQNHRRVKSASWVSLGVWLLAAAVTWPSLVVRSTFELAPDWVVCINDYQPPWNQAAVELVRMLLGFVVPLLTILVSYSLIVHWIRVSRLSGSKQRSKPFKLMSAVVLTFFLCWLPYHVVGLLLLTSTKVPLVWGNLSVGLASINSAVNPFLYVFAGQDARRSLRVSLASAIRAALVEESFTASSSRAVTNSSQFASEVKV